MIKKILKSLREDKKYAILTEIDSDCHCMEGEECTCEDDCHCKED